MPLFTEYAQLRRVAICPPQFFKLAEPINAIQAIEVQRGLPISAERASVEHAALARALQESGAELLIIPPDPHFPYQINTRDAGIATTEGLLLANFRLAARQGEEECARAAVGQAGVEVIGKVGRASFEGGDFVALNANLAAVGLGPRTEPGALGELQAALGPDCELIAVRFEERYLHLDMIFNVIGPDLALACPAALPARFVQDVRARGFRLIEVSTEEVFDHACNVLATAAESVISHSRIPRINQRLLAEGYRLTVLEVTELARSGGGPRCLTLPLDREQS